MPRDFSRPPDAQTHQRKGPATVLTLPTVKTSETEPRLSADTAYRETILALQRLRILSPRMLFAIHSIVVHFAERAR